MRSVRGQEIPRPLTDLMLFSLTHSKKSESFYFEVEAVSIYW